MIIHGEASVVPPSWVPRHSDQLPAKVWMQKNPVAIGRENEVLLEMAIGDLVIKESRGEACR